MNRTHLCCFYFATTIDRFAKHVEDATKCCFANGNRNRSTRVDAIRTATQTFGRTKSNAANTSAAKVLIDFTGQRSFFAARFDFDFYRVVNRGQAIWFELGVECRSDYLGDATCICHYLDSDKSFLIVFVFCFIDFKFGMGFQIPV